MYWDVKVLNTTHPRGMRRGSGISSAVRATYRHNDNITADVNITDRPNGTMYTSALQLWILYIHLAFLLREIKSGSVE